jgi:hypothetical protein
MKDSTHVAIHEVGRVFRVLESAVLATMAGAVSCGGGGQAPGEDGGTTSTLDGSSAMVRTDAGTASMSHDAAATAADGRSPLSDGSSSASDAAANDGSNDGASSPDAPTSTEAGASVGPFTCTEVIGLEITSEWWSAGFLSDGVVPTKCELKWHHQGYVGAWADPNSPFWSNQGNAQDSDAGAPIVAPCGQDSVTPDRVLFVAVDFEMMTKDAWVAALDSVVATIKMKYSPNLKWIDLATLVRCPNDVMCNPDEDYGPGANLDVSHEDCYVPPYVDSAIAQVIAANPGFVGLGPEPQATACNSPVNGPHLSAASNAAAANAIAAYFVQNP